MLAIIAAIIFAIAFLLGVMSTATGAAFCSRQPAAPRPYLPGFAHRGHRNRLVFHGPPPAALTGAPSLGPMMVS